MLRCACFNVELVRTGPLEVSLTTMFGDVVRLTVRDASIGLVAGVERVDIIIALIGRAIQELDEASPPSA